MVLLITLTDMSSKVVLKMYVNNIYFCSSTYAKLHTLRTHVLDILKNNFNASVLAKQLATALYTQRINLIYGNKRNVVVGGSNSMYLNNVLANVFSSAKVVKIKSVNFSFLTNKKKK